MLCEPNNDLKPSLQPFTQAYGRSRVTKCKRVISESTELHDRTTPRYDLDIKYPILSMLVGKFSQTWL